MLQAEYDYDLDMQVKAEEAKEEKAVEAALVLIKDFHAEPEVATQKMNAPLDKVLESFSSTTVHA